MLPCLSLLVSLSRSSKIVHYTQNISFTQALHLHSEKSKNRLDGTNIIFRTIHIQETIKIFYKVLREELLAKGEKS